MIIELALIIIFALRVLQPGGATIIFPKSGQNQNPTSLSVLKNLLLPLKSGRKFLMNFLSRPEPLDLSSY